MYSTIDRFPPEMIPLSDRIERLSGCQGHWILDLRNPEDPRGHDAHYLGSGVCRAGYGTIKDTETALKFALTINGAALSSYSAPISSTLIVHGREATMPRQSTEATIGYFTISLDKN